MKKLLLNKLTLLRRETKSLLNNGENSILLFSSAKTAQKNSIKKKTTIGPVEHTNLALVAKCGGVVAKEAKMHLDVSIASTLLAMTKMRIKLSKMQKIKPNY